MKVQGPTCDSRYWLPLLDPLRKSLNLLIGRFGPEIMRTLKVPNAPPVR